MTFTLKRLSLTFSEARGVQVKRLEFCPNRPILRILTLGVSTGETVDVESLLLECNLSVDWGELEEDFNDGLDKAKSGGDRSPRVKRVTESLSSLLNESNLNLNLLSPFETGISCDR